MPRTGKLPGLLRPQDLEARGVPRWRIQAMLHSGELLPVARGLYRLRDAPLTELETVAAVSARIPGGVICLLTALYIHELGTQVPREVWIAIDRKAWKPRTPGLPVHVVRFSAQMLQYEVESREVIGVRVCVTSPVRTVVDCFRYRRKIGLDVAVEALRDAVGRRRVTIAALARVANACRIGTVMRPYLEALVP